MHALHSRSLATSHERAELVPLLSVQRLPRKQHVMYNVLSVPIRALLTRLLLACTPRDAGDKLSQVAQHLS